MIPFARVLKYGNIAPAPVGIKDVKSMQNTVYILLTDGRLYGFGLNNKLQLGTGDTTQPTTWLLLLDGVADIWCGSGDGTCVLAYKHDGTWWSTGNQGFLGTSGSLSVWTNVSAKFAVTGNEYKKLVMSAYGTLMLMQNGDLWRIGINASGILFTGNTSAVPAFVKTSEVDVVDIMMSLTGEQSYVLYKNGTLKGCGSNEGYALSNVGVPTAKYYVLVQVSNSMAHINSESGYVSMVMGHEANLIFCCGSKYGGQLGVGTPTGLNDGFKIAQATAIPAGTIQYIGSANYSTHVKVNNKWYYSGVDNRSAGFGLTTGSQVSTFVSDSTGVIDSLDISKMAHGFYITFALINGELYASGINGNFGSFPWESGTTAQNTGRFMKINTPT